MSGNNTSWFHCGRCGSLFQSAIGDLDDRTCDSCGRDPSLGTAVPRPEAGPVPATVLPEKRSGRPTREKHGTHHRKGGGGFMLKLALGWCAALAAILFVADRFSSTPEETSPQARTAPHEETLSPQDVAALSEATGQCSVVFSGFLSAGTPEERNQFVLAPITTAARMARFYELNPLVTVDPGTVQLTGQGFVDLPAGRAIETQWLAGGDRRLDAVFVQDNGEWRLDWEHFARFSDFPWSLFLAGSGPDHGEFRLLARERLADERKHESTISLVLYAPRFGKPGDAENQSPEFIIPRDSENGRLLDAAFALKRSGKKAFGSMLPDLNPEGMIRVRAKVRRIEENRERRFEIEKVTACHWYSAEGTGVDVPAK